MLLKGVRVLLEYGMLFWLLMFVGRISKWIFLDMKEIPFSWSKNHSYIYGEGRLCFALNLIIWQIFSVTGSAAERSAAGFGRCL
jgi:hypothetical protein